MLVQEKKVAKENMIDFLETQRLIIKIPSLQDIDHWIALHSPTEAIVGTSELVETWINHDIHHFIKHGFGMGSVYNKKSGKFIGRAGLTYLDHDDTQPDIEIGYMLLRTCWNKGYGTELAKACKEWGFENLRTNKLVAVTRPENRRSQHVLEKIGMQYIKTVQFRNEDFLYYAIFHKIAVKN